jgi:hypothetical protein
MRQTIRNAGENGANPETIKTAGPKTTIYLNERNEGFCDCCNKDFPPRALIRHSYTADDGRTKYTIVSYLCAACKA